MSEVKKKKREGESINETAKVLAERKKKRTGEEPVEISIKKAKEIRWILKRVLKSIRVEKRMIKCYVSITYTLIYTIKFPFILKV